MDGNSAPVSIARRVLVIVPSRHSAWSTAWDKPEKVIEIALEVLKEKGLIPIDRCELSDARFIAKERWTAVTYLVFDIFHTAYDPVTAHIAGRNDLPLLAVWIGNHTAMAATKGLEMQVNEDVREIHDNTGLGSQPPFDIDHLNGSGPTYSRPRTVIILPANNIPAPNC
ncbi:hypothetical protein GGR58DRAFT_507635 [Xylaria digitata]|nr:hypothetical protein GGR58DRAFT_507635 [Xylaria digitata]